MNSNHTGVFYFMPCAHTGDQSGGNGRERLRLVFRFCCKSEGGGRVEFYDDMSQVGALRHARLRMGHVILTHHRPLFAQGSKPTEVMSFADFFFYMGNQEGMCEKFHQVSAPKLLVSSIARDAEPLLPSPPPLPPLD